MKKLLLSFLGFGFVLTAQAQTLTVGNIAILRLGDSVTTLANTGAAVAIDQITATGSYVNSVILPRTGANAVTLGATATSEGQLTLASNASSINLFGYKSTYPYSAAINTSTSAAVSRVVVSINASGVISMPTLTATNFSASNPRCVASNGVSYWGVGGVTGIAHGNSTSNLDTIVSNTTTNIRNINIFAGRLFYTSASGTSGVYRMSSAALPVNSGNTATPYIATGTGSSPYGFAFNPDTSICYISDDRVIASGGGIQKWTRAGSTWTLAYTLGTGTTSTVGARALSVNWSGTRPVIVAVTAEASLNRIISITDIGSTSAALTLATASANTVYRGVSFTPGTNVLPVKYNSLTAANTPNGNLVKWSTASEKNNSHFNIERSLNGSEYEVIGLVKGAGNTNKVMSYSFVDVGNYTGTACYRLNQVDYDGNSELSKSVCVTTEQAKAAVVATTPNPFNDKITVVYNSATASAVTFEVIDLIGKVHYNTTEHVKGDHAFTVNTSAFPQGIYFIRITNGNEVKTQRIIKK
ncbi:MAG: T9SS type A sorting domain-containing protein [Bacteroidota bacterium]